MFEQDHLHIFGGDGAPAHLMTAGVKRENICNCLTGLDMLGPVSLYLSPKAQLAWLDEHAPDLWKFVSLDIAEWEAEACTVLETIQHWKGPKTIWFSSKNIAEFSFYLAIVSVQKQILDFDFVDVGQSGFFDTMECGPENIEAVWEKKSRFSEEHFAAIQLKVQELDADDVELLYLNDDGEIEKAPFPHFDPDILRHVSKNWNKIHRVYFSFFDAEARDFKQRRLGYHFFLWRLEQLRQNGVIERRDHKARPLYWYGPNRQYDRLEVEIRLTEGTIPLIDTVSDTG